MAKDKNESLYFKIDMPQLLAEIADSGLVKNGGVLKIPLNIFRIKLGLIAERAAIINDPVLNLIMFECRLYETPSPATPAYSKQLKRLEELAKQQLEKEKNHGHT